MGQTWDAQEYARNGRFVADLASEVLAWLDVQPGESVLDLGCGDGALTAVLADRGAHVKGLDSSPEMVHAAQARGLDVSWGSGEELAFEQTFDAVFSNAALHWMADQNAVLAGIHRALRPRGRFVAELGGHGNIAAIRTALRAVLAPLGLEAEDLGSNTFFGVAEYRALLERHGFAVRRIELVPRPTVLPAGVRGWVQTFRRSLLGHLQEHQREQVLSAVEELLAPILRDRDGTWYGDYVRLRFEARKI